MLISEQIKKKIKQVSWRTGLFPHACAPSPVCICRRTSTRATFYCLVSFYLQNDGLMANMYCPQKYFVLINIWYLFLYRAIYRRKMYLFFVTLKKSLFTRMIFPQSVFKYMNSLSFYAFLMYLENYGTPGILWVSK